MSDIKIKKTTSLEVGKVYLWLDKYLVYIKNKHKQNGRLYFDIARIRENGKLGKSNIQKVKPSEFKIVEDAKVHITVELKEEYADKIQFSFMVDDCDEILRQLKKGLISKPKAKEKLGRIIYASISLYNSEKERNYNIRDFAKALRLKKYTGIYRFCIEFMKSRVGEDLSQIHNCADSTVVMMYENYKKYWPSIYGFNKDLNKILDTHMSQLIREKKRRGLF